MSNHVLYRMFNELGELLYVGMTCSAPRRIKEHSKDKAWWRQVSRISLEHHDSRISLESAERAAIATESPLFNVTGRSGFRQHIQDAQPPNEDFSYLVGKYFVCDDQTLHRGRVVATVGHRQLVIELWGDSDLTVKKQRIVSSSGLSQWTFFESAEDQELYCTDHSRQASSSAVHSSVYECAKDIPGALDNNNEDWCSQDFPKEVLERWISDLRVSMGDSWFSARDLIGRLGYGRSHTYRIVQVLSDRGLIESRQVGVQRKQYRIPRADFEEIKLDLLNELEISRLEAVSRTVEANPGVGVAELRRLVGGRNQMTDEALLVLVKAGFIESVIDGKRKSMRSIKPFRRPVRSWLDRSVV